MMLCSLLILDALVLSTGVQYSKVTGVQNSKSTGVQHSKSHKLQQSLHEIPEFDAYVHFFAKDYVRGSSEYIARRELYEKRADGILSTNMRSDAAWTAAVNQFTDRTESELQAFRGWTRRGHTGTPKARAVSLLGSRPPVESVDWTKDGAKAGKKLASLTVKDQDACGSCWAFATVAMLSAHYELATGKVKDFSPQELVDCTDNPKKCGGTGGCDGATVELALEYVTNVSLQKLRTRSGYSYTAKTGKCHKPDTRAMAQVDNAVSMTRFQTLPENSALDLMNALVQGPVAVSVGASNDWFFYDSGVFGDCSKDSVINHAVLMVGYGNGFWRIQNSWGSYWGENGYMKLKRFGSQQDSAHCGIDNKPQDGVACEPYPDQVTVCGMCGILYDSVSMQMHKLDKPTKRH